MLGCGRGETGRRDIAAWKPLSWNPPLRMIGYWSHRSTAPFFFSYRLEIGMLHVVLKHFVGWHIHTHTHTKPAPVITSLIFFII